MAREAQAPLLILVARRVAGALATPAEPERKSTMKAFWPPTITFSARYYLTSEAGHRDLFALEVHIGATIALDTNGFTGESSSPGAMHGSD
jgi:hypothetical protein